MAHGYIRGLSLKTNSHEKVTIGLQQP